MIIFELYSNLIPKMEQLPPNLNKGFFYWTTLYLCLCCNHSNWATVEISVRLCILFCVFIRGCIPKWNEMEWNHLNVIQWFVSCFKGSWFFRLKIHNEISPEPSSTLHKYHFYTQKYYHEYETLPFKTKNRKVLYLKFQYKNKYNLGLQIDPFVILYRIWLMV